MIKEEDEKLDKVIMVLFLYNTTLIKTEMKEIKKTQQQYQHHHDQQQQQQMRWENQKIGTARIC